MSAPMVNHVLVNPSLRFTIKSSIGLLRRHNKLSTAGKNHEKYYTSQKVDKLPSEQKEVETDGQHIEADDFFGVTEFYRSIPPRTDPSPGLVKDVLRTKYKILEHNKAKQFDTMKVPYGIVRLDAGVAQQYRRDEQEGQNRVHRRRRRENTNMKTDTRKEMSDSQMVQHDKEQFSENLAQNSHFPGSAHDLDSLHYISKNNNSYQRNFVKTASENKNDHNNPDFCLSIKGESLTLNRNTEEYRNKDSHENHNEADMPNWKKMSFTTSIDRDIEPDCDKIMPSKEGRVNFIDQAYFGSYNFNEEAKTVSQNERSNDFGESLKRDNCLNSQNVTASNEELNYVDQNYFGSYGTETKIKTPGKMDSTQNFKHERATFDNDIDEQYFGQAAKHDLNVLKSETNNNDKAKLSGFEDFARSVETFSNNKEGEFKDSAEKEDSFIDDQYFGTFNGSYSQITKPSDMSELPLIFNKFDNNYAKGDNEENTSIKGDNLGYRYSKGDNLRVNYSTEDSVDDSYLNSGESYKKDRNYTSENDFSKSEERFEKNEDKIVKKTDQFSQSNADLFSEIKSQEITSAEEVARKMRKELKEPSKDTTKDSKSESKTLRQSKEIRKRLDQMTSSEVAKLLYDNIVYNRGDVVGLNKPYGLAIHDGPDIHVSVGHCLEKLKNHIDSEIDNLYMVNHLDKDMTGVVLLAKSELMAARLKDAFKAKQVIWKYFLVTKGVPKPEEGIIDIPMAEGKVEGKYRMTLRPQGFSKQRDTVKAVTQYKVLTSTGNAALVECTPLTAVKHQIRAHMFYGLNTPILGDHKYSHFNKMAPQKLFPEMLTRLKIRQAEVRNLPLHLHARSLIIPEFEDGRNLYVHCRIPDFYVTNMKKLKLNFKEFL